ncbi:Outer dynein arm protein 1 [Diplonema papillatum]|nr:Outer dynein arm protein 1 [Diplonema papillatum]
MTAAHPTDQQMMEKKLRLLETDRKLHFESSQVSIKQNNELIRSLRQDNKELTARTRLAREGTIGSNVDTIHCKKTQMLDVQIHAKRRQLDELKARCDTKKKEVARFEEALAQLHTETQPVYKEESPLDRKIRMLENRLDKSMIKYNEAMSIRRTYEQIVRRLKDERVGFDNQLAAIERTLKAKDHDYQELLNMSHDAAHAKDVARAELAQFKAAYEEEKRQKDRELEERKRLVQRRLDQTQKLERSEKQRRVEEENAARREAEEKEKEKGMRATNDIKTVEEREREEEYEMHFKKIKEATGVTDPDESVAVLQVINKFLTQEETHKNLVEMTKDAQAKMASYHEEKEELTARVEEIKYSGSGQLGSRRIVDEFEAHLAEAKHQCEQNRNKYERVAKILINVKAGVQHLADKMMLSKTELPNVTDENALQVLRTCDAKLQTLVEESIPVDGAEVAPPEHIELPVHNRRIKIPSELEQDDVVDDEDDEEVDDLMDRDTVKKLASMAVQREHKKMKKRGKKSKD